jgi:hypothetical protein
MAGSCDGFSRMLLEILKDNDGLRQALSERGVTLTGPNCTAPHIGALVRLLGEDALRTILTLADAEYAFVFEDAAASLTTDERASLLVQLSEHMRSCQRCQTTTKMERHVDDQLTKALLGNKFKILDLPINVDDNSDLARLLKVQIA